jgi:hypothetical protein
MQKESKVQLSKMMSLMERMDKHYTNDQAKVLLENDLRSKNLLKEEIEEADRGTAVQIDNNTYSLSDPEELVRVLSKKDMTPQKGWFVTMGYVCGVTELGDKQIQKGVDSFEPGSPERVKSLGFDRLNNIIDNPTIIDKGINKGKIKNPYMPDSNSNFIVKVEKIQLMYGRNEEYGKRKQDVEHDLEAYQHENPEDVQHYIDYVANRPKNPYQITSFPQQAYGMKSDNRTRVPNTNIFQYPDGSYEMDFNTPLKVYKRLKVAYFLINDENNIEEITPEEVKAYVDLFGVKANKKVANEDEIVARVEKFINDTKTKRHNGDLYNHYKLNSIFLLNFATEDGRQKLQFYNPNAVVRFVKGKELKSGITPSRYTASGLLKPHLEKMKQ